MGSSGQAPPRPAKRHSSGPHGTRLYSTEALRQYAVEVEAAPAGPASTNRPVLEGIGPGLEHLRFTLHAGRQTFGRGSENDLIIDDPSVSASHGWIIIQSGHYVIMNTLSTNGTYVNDNRIHEATLKHGDHIRLGQAEFLFLTREDKRRFGWPRRLALALALGLILILAALLAWHLF